MRGLIKFGISCWTRKIELSKSMELTKGKMSLEQEQNWNSSLPVRQEAGMTLRAAVSTVHMQEPFAKAAPIFILVHLTQSCHGLCVAVCVQSITQPAEKATSWQRNSGSWGQDGFVSEVASVSLWCRRTVCGIRWRLVGDSLSLDVFFTNRGILPGHQEAFLHGKCC